MRWFGPMAVAACVVAIASCSPKKEPEIVGCWKMLPPVRHSDSGAAVLGEFTNEWIRFRPDGECVYHAPYSPAIRSKKTLFSNLVNEGHAFADAHSSNKPLDSASDGDERSKKVTWKYLPGDDALYGPLPPDASGRIVLEFFVNGKREDSFLLAVKESLWGATTLEVVLWALDGTIELSFKRNHDCDEED